jgi:nucleotide-binding universal stress UspA family protein
MLNKFKRIIVPTDFGETAQSALRVAAAMAAYYRAQLDIVSVVDSTVYAYAGYPFATLAQDLMKSAEEQLNALKLPEETKGLTVKRFVLSGSAGHEIADHARRHSADLIVMATHGRGVVARFFLGSVADQVLHAAPCPVLVLRKPEETAKEHAKAAKRKGKPFTKILVPTDFSPTSQLALNRAIALTEDYDAELVVLHVLDDELISTHVQAERDMILKQLQTHALAEMKGQLPADLVENFHTIGAVKRGDPAKAIPAYADAHDCDLIVMGSHGRTGIGRVLLGSVADGVVRHAKCPVLVERAKEAAAVHSEMAKQARILGAKLIARGDGILSVGAHVSNDELKPVKPMRSGDRVESAQPDAAATRAKSKGKQDRGPATDDQDDPNDLP